MIAIRNAVHALSPHPGCTAWAEPTTLSAALTPKVAKWGKPKDVV